jgi:hypothetical protein
MNAIARMLVLALGYAASASADPAPDVAWPPAPETRSRMAELQAVMSDPKSTPEARSSARAELKRLLQSPAAKEKEPEGDEAPKRARTPLAVAPSMPSPAPPSTSSTPVTGAPRESDPPVAHVVPAPRAIPPFIDPQTGRTLVPSGQVAIDPATGRAYPQVPGGYVDPSSGRPIRPR